MLRLGILVEVVGREHHQANPRILDHRTEIAGKGAATRGVNSEHPNEIAAQIPFGWRDDNRRLKLLCPALLPAIYRLEFTANGIAQDRQPDHFRFRYCEADTAILEDR